MKRLKKLTKTQGLINTFNFFFSTSKNTKILSRKRKFLLTPALFNMRNAPTIEPKTLFVWQLPQEALALKLRFGNVSVGSKQLFFQNFFYNIYIKSHKPTTPTLRFSTKYFKIRFKNRINFFKTFLKNKAGRLYNNNKITILSKGFKKKERSVVTILKKPIRCLFIFTNLFKSKSRLLILCRQACGTLFILPYIYGVQPGQLSNISNLPTRFLKFTNPGSLLLLRFLDLTYFFSNIILADKPKYAVSNGTFCQIVERFIDYNIICINLPSKQSKFLSGWVFALVGRNALIESNTIISKGAGSLYTRGVKPKVRGVARNPVDHPHGGRTKTNQPEKSIWGWVAKRGK